MNTQLSQLFEYVFEKNSQTGAVPRMGANELAIWFEKQCKQLKSEINEEEVFEMALTTLSNVFYLDDFKHQRFEAIKRKFNLYLKKEFCLEGIDKRKEVEKILIAISNKLTPNWSLDVIENMVNSLYYFFRKVLITNDDAVIERVNLAFAQLTKHIDSKSMKPEYFYVTVLNNLLLTEDKKEYIKIQNKVKENFLSLFNQEFIDFDVNLKKTFVKRLVYIENPLDYEKLRDEVDTISLEDAEENTKAVISAYTNLLKHGGLSKAEQKMLKALIESLDLEGEQTYKEYIKKVRQIINATPENTRQIINRIRKRINLPENQELKSQLFGFKQVSDDMLALAFLEEMFNETNENMKKENTLEKMNFSNLEESKKSELISLFQCSNYEIDHSPEVYYDDYDNWKKSSTFSEDLIDFMKDWDSILAQMNSNNPSIKIPIEYLGVYCDYTIKGEIETKEGIVVLFKDRIEQYATYLAENENRLSISENIDILQLLVLIHELGHWMCHWPLADGGNWKIGYGLDNPKTHESLAQLITYWMVENQGQLKKYFEAHLVPTNPNNIYALYKKLTGFEKVKIIDKIKFLRNHYFLNDDISHQILESTNEITNVDFWKEYFDSESVISFSINLVILKEQKKYFSEIFNSFTTQYFSGVSQDKLIDFLSYCEDYLFTKEKNNFYDINGEIISHRKKREKIEKQVRYGI